MRTEGTELRALVPVSIRAEDERGALGNRIAAMRGPLPVYVDDPVERLRVVQQGMGELKESKQALGAEVIAGLTDFAPPTLLAQASRLNFSTRLFNLIVTNVPGPQFPLYLLGREMQEIVPIAFLPENHALAIAIMSYNGKVDFGLLADYDAMPDLDAFAEHLEESLDELLAAARKAGKASAPLERRARRTERPARRERRRRPPDAPPARRAPGPRGRGSPRARRRTRRRPTRSATPARRRTACCSARRRPTRERVPSFDGVPLDVDVTLPRERRRPVPDDRDDARLRRHKSAFEAHVDARSGYNNVFYAQQGYAVVNYSARGFGRSCGTPDSRTSPGCDGGWIHLADHRYEARDTQHLLGLLVDQGVAQADAIGVTGVSYGGIQSLNLARLRDRIRLPDGSFRPWRSPNGTPLRIAAAYRAGPAPTSPTRFSRTAASSTSGTPKPDQSIAPGGVMKKSYNDGLYLSGQRERLLRPERAARSAPTSRPGRRSPTAASPRARTRWPWAGSSPASTAGRA